MPPEKEKIKQKKILGLNKNVFILGLTSFFNDFSNEMILSAFPAFFTSVLKSGAASLGLVEGIADGASNFLKIYSGNLSDRIRKRKIFILIGYSLSVATRPFYILTGTVSQVLGLRFLDRIGKGIREAPRDVIISVSSERENMGRSFGFHKAMDSAGGFLGPLCAYFILLKWPGNFNYIFILAFFLGIIAVFTIFFVTEIRGSGINGFSKLSIKNFFKFPVKFKFYLISIFILSTGSLPVAILLLRVSDIGLLIASIPLFYMIYSGSFSIFSVLAGKMTDKFGTAKMFLLGYFILIISYIFTAYSSSIIILIISFILLGAFSAFAESTQRSYVALTIPEFERGSAYGLYNGAVGFGAIFAGIAGGYMWQNLGAYTTLLIFSFLIFLGLSIFYFGNNKSVIK